MQKQPEAGQVAGFAHPNGARSMVCGVAGGCIRYGWGVDRSMNCSSRVADLLGAGLGGGLGT